MLYAVRSSDPIRVLSPRQLPTDPDCAVPTREYQSDQPSQWPLLLSPALSLSGLARPSQTKTTRLNVTLDRIAPYQSIYNDVGGVKGQESPGKPGPRLVSSNLTVNLLPPAIYSIFPHRP